MTFSQFMILRQKLPLTWIGSFPLYRRPHSYIVSTFLKLFLFSIMELQNISFYIQNLNYILHMTNFLFKNFVLFWKGNKMTREHHNECKLQSHWQLTLITNVTFILFLLFSKSLFASWKYLQSLIKLTNGGPFDWRQENSFRQPNLPWWKAVVYGTISKD